jgi:organic radical activating enzyme
MAYFPRTLFADKNGELNSGVKFFDVRFNNTCNLKCITCGPAASSKWQNEAKNIYNITIKHHKFFKEEFVTDFVNNAPGIIHIDIAGGEPFLSGVSEQKQLLQHYIDSGKADEISLHYTTNVTVFPDSEWWELWQHFKEIDMQLSIDGIGARYEYIRFPADWSQVQTNVDLYKHKQSQLPNVKLSVSHTVSAYNIYYLDEFFSWCYNQQLPRPWLGRVHKPVHMKPTVWPSTVRTIIAEHLNTSSWVDVKNWAGLVGNTDDSEYFDLFKEKLQQHDQYRNLDFKSTFPELAPYL